MYILSSNAAAIAASLLIATPFATAVPLNPFQAIGIATKAPGEDGDSELQRWSSLIGIITAIVGNILISFALNIQRYAHIRLHQERRNRKLQLRKNSRQAKNGYGTTPTNSFGRENSNRAESPEEDESDPLMDSFMSQDSQMNHSHTAEEFRTSYLKSPYWWAGIVLMTIGETGNFLAYGFAPASIVSPLGVVALISNCVIAPIMLKETFRWRDFWGVVIAIAGAVTVVLSAKQEEKKLGPHEVLGAITTTAFEIYMGVTIGLIALLIWASPRYGNRTILIDLGLVGLFGGYTALSTKGVASMLSFTLWKAFTTPITYALIAILVGTALMQVKYVNKALQRFDSTQVIPVQFVLFTLSVIIGSAVLYRDFEKTTPERATKFVGGCLLTFLGVFFITSGRDTTDEEFDPDSDEEGEVTLDLTDQRPTDAQNLHDKASKSQTSAAFLSDTSQNGDMTDGSSDARHARGVSHVSFLPRDDRPETPINPSNTSHPPSIVLTPSANVSSSSINEDSPLVANPWRSSTEELRSSGQHPGIPSIATSPVLPKHAQVLPESSPRLRPGRSNSQTNPHTHPNLQQGPTPPPPDVLERPSQARHSITRSMLPGPFISPLSAPLSAVVADTMRRGVDSPLRLKDSLRRAKRLRKSKSQRMGDESAVEDDDQDTLRRHHSSVDESGSGRATIVSRSLGADLDWTKRTRSKSLSNTLGGLFSIRKKRKDSEGDEDHSGPSNEV